MRIVLFQVNTPADKIARLVQTCFAHFERKEPLLIFTEDEKAAQYVDELLWKAPLTGFLPHGIDSQDVISITFGKKKLEDHRLAFNLCATPLLVEGFKQVYDFEDLTSPSKKQFSAIRFDAYKKAGYLIEAR